MSKDLDFSPARTVTGDALLGENTRLGRLAWLMKYVRADDLYFVQDGALSEMLFREAADSFVNGQFLATIVLAFSFIERSIAGRLSYIGENKTAEGKSKDLLAAALDRGWLTPDEIKSLDEIRLLRNPIVHYRDSFDAKRPEIRAALEGKPHSILFEADARKVLEAAIHIILAKTAL